MSSTVRAPADQSVRHALALMVALTGGAFAQSPTRGHAPLPPNGYDDGWFVSEFWSREYPPGFSVTRPDAAVAARAAMDKAAARTVACRLPYLAVIHPWNRSRPAKSKVRFLLLSDLGLAADTGEPVKGEVVAGISEVGPGQADYGKARSVRRRGAELERARGR